jgi:hypothetical protein
MKRTPRSTIVALLHERDTILQKMEVVCSPARLEEGRRQSLQGSKTGDWIQRLLKRGSEAYFGRLDEAESGLDIRFTNLTPCFLSAFRASYSSRSCN